MKSTLQKNFIALKEFPPLPVSHEVRNIEEPSYNTAKSLSEDPEPYLYVLIFGAWIAAVIWFVVNPGN